MIKLSRTSNEQISDSTKETWPLSPHLNGRKFSLEDQIDSIRRQTVQRTAPPSTLRTAYPDINKLLGGHFLAYVGTDTTLTTKTMIRNQLFWKISSLAIGTQRRLILRSDEFVVLQLEEEGERHQIVSK